MAAGEDLGLTWAVSIVFWQGSAAPRAERRGHENLARQGGLQADQAEGLMNIFVEMTAGLRNKHGAR